MCIRDRVETLDADETGIGGMKSVEFMVKGSGAYSILKYESGVHLSLIHICFMKYSGIGGQAVMEGVMMQNKDTYAVAVRKPDHEIDVKVSKRKNSKALDAVRKRCV